MKAVLLASVLPLLAQLEGASREASPGTVLEAAVQDGAFTVDMRIDLDLLLLGPLPAASIQDRVVAMERLSADPGAAKKAIDRLLRLFERRVRVRFDGNAAPFDVELPERRSTADGRLLTLGGRVVLRGAVRADAAAFTVFASRSFRGVDLRVVANGRRSRQLLEPGEESEPILLSASSP